MQRLSAAAAKSPRILHFAYGRRRGEKGPASRIVRYGGRLVAGLWPALAADLDCSTMTVISTAESYENVADASGCALTIEADLTWPQNFHNSIWLRCPATASEARG